MTQQIVRPEDFKTPPGVHQIQRMVYRGEGSPIGQKTSPTLGAIYIDYIAGNIWSCSTINDVNGWQPFYTYLQTGITIDTDVQEGDFIGIYGPGTWTNASAATNVARDSTVSGGSEFSAWMAGGQTAVAALSSTETFNGTSWLMSANSLLTAPATPGTGELLNLHGSGSQSAAWALGGTIFAGTAYSFMQTFNGETWTLSSAVGLTITSKGASGGTLYSAWNMLGDFNGLNGEYFNGSSWLRIPLNGIFITIGRNKGNGTSNSHFATGGAISSSGSAYSYTFAYNGFAYFVSNYLNNPRVDHLASGSTLNTLISGGSNDLGGGRTYYTSSEFYNGCTWGTGNPLSISVRARGANSGSRNMGMIAAGTTNGTTKLSSTELHTQSIYRRLDFTKSLCAIDIGMAYGVTNANYTASNMTGDIITHRVPYKRFFGFNRHQHYSSNFYLESPRAINSIVANVDGTMTVVVATSNLEITKGMLFEITGSATTVNNGIFPVTNFSGGATITVKNPNAMNQGASGNASLLWGNRIIGLPTQMVTVGSSVDFAFNLTGSLSTNTFHRLIPKNSIVYVPYAATSGAAGSQYNYGTYIVNLMVGNALLCSPIHSKHQTETITCTTVEILTHSIAKSVAEAEDFVLGYNGRMNLNTNTSNDANYDRW